MTRASLSLSRRGSNLAALAIAALAFSFAAEGRADEAAPAAPSGSTEDRAAAFYKQGHDLYEQGKPAEAEKAYQSAWDLRQSFDVAANLGNVELVLGQAKDAATHLAFALESFPLSGAPDKKQALQKRLDEARAQVGSLKVTVSPAGAEVAIDGAVVKGPLPPEIYVDAGDHVLLAKREGFTGVPAHVHVDKGGSQSVALTLTAVAAAPPPATAPDTGESAGSKSKPLLVAGAVIGVAGIGTGIGLLAASGSKGTTATTLRAEIQPTGNCPNPVAGSKCDDLTSALKSKDTLHNVGLPVLVVGSAALVATVIYALIPAEKKKNSRAIRPMPVVSTQGLGMSMSGSF